MTHIEVIGGSDATVDVGDDLLGDHIRLHATLQIEIFFYEGGVGFHPCY